MEIKISKTRIRDSDKQYGLNAVPSLSLIYLFLIICLAGCFPQFTSEPFSENSYMVGGYEVEEKIYEGAGIPDYIYERVYRVKNGRRWVDIGSYDDESTMSITTPPKLVDGWVVIYSGAHLYLWKPDEGSRHFTPYSAEGWNDYADQFGTYSLNGHYDYRVTQFLVDEGHWSIKYVCVYCRSNDPEEIIFISDDEGKTYTVEQSPN